jgi:hypothetical protein
MKTGVLAVLLCLALPAAALAQDENEIRNAPAAEPDHVDDIGGAPLNSTDGMTGDDYQEQDLNAGVGNKLNQQQCIALGRYLMQTQTTVEVQQSLKARGCQ